MTIKEKEARKLAFTELRIELEGLDPEPCACADKDCEFNKGWNKLREFLLNDPRIAGWKGA